MVSSWWIGCCWYSSSSSSGLNTSRSAADLAFLLRINKNARAPMSATPTTPPTTPPAIAPLLVDDSAWGTDKTVADGKALDVEEGRSVETISVDWISSVVVGGIAASVVDSGIIESVVIEGVAFGSIVAVVSALGSTVVVVSHQLVVVSM